MAEPRRHRDYLIAKQEILVLDGCIPVLSIIFLRVCIGDGRVALFAQQEP